MTLCIRDGRLTRLTLESDDSAYDRPAAVADFTGNESDGSGTALRNVPAISAREEPSERDERERQEKQARKGGAGKTKKAHVIGYFAYPARRPIS